MAKDVPYYDDFISMTKLSHEAAEFLYSTLTNFNHDNLEKQRVDMHAIEHAADKVKHSIMARLVKEFVPPLDREDIIQLAGELDDVTDKIEDVLICMDMFNIKVVRPEALALVDVIVRCCKTLVDAMVEFPNFHKSTDTIRKAIIEVNSMEEEGDAIYIDAMRDLYRKGGDPVEISVWTKIFDRLEECCDACEHVSDVVDVIIMKNS